MTFSGLTSMVIAATLTTVPSIPSYDPYAIAIDSNNNVYTANRNNNTISKVTSTDVITYTFATLNSNDKPYGIAIDSNNNVYTANYNNSTISKVTSSGVLTDPWATL